MSDFPMKIDDWHSDYFFIFGFADYRFVSSIKIIKTIIFNSGK